MNIKITAITLAAAGVMLASATQALAYPWLAKPDMTKVTATQNVSSNTGANHMNDKAEWMSSVNQWGNSSINTGEAYAQGDQMVVTDVKMGCFACRPSYQTDMTKVRATQNVSSNTGSNQMNNHAKGMSSVNQWGNSTITTKDSAAFATQWVVTDTNVGGWMWLN